MPDLMDKVQELVDQERERAVARITQKGVGRAHCIECGDSINTTRQELGAVLCVEHQELLEARERMYGKC